MNRILIDVDNLSQVMDYYDQIKIYRATSETGSYSEITDVDTRIVLEAEREQYYYSDDDGDDTSWYKTAWYNSVTTDESDFSDPRQGGTEAQKIGYSFGNYSAPPGEWGRVVTADDMRFTFVWGVDMKASDVGASEVDDEQLNFVVENAMAEFEHHFNIDIRKRVYKTEPASSLLRSPVWREGVDYTDEEDPYDFDPNQWDNYGFLQLRHHPLISVEDAGLYSAWGQKILDINAWLRLYKKSGQIHIYPKGATLYGIGYVGTGLVAAWPQLFGRRYPHGFRIDYTTGWPSSDFVDRDLRNAIGMLGTVNLLNWMGDGLMAGFSSSSVSLDGLSESFSSTQSATSAYFGARIKQYTDYLKKFCEKNRLKYGNVPMGFV